jgi:hypothetical protein
MYILLNLRYDMITRVRILIPQTRSLMRTFRAVFTVRTINKAFSALIFTQAHTQNFHFLENSGSSRECEERKGVEAGRGLEWWRLQMLGKVERRSSWAVLSYNINHHRYPTAGSFITIKNTIKSALNSLYEECHFLSDNKQNPTKRKIKTISTPLDAPHHITLPLIRVFDKNLRLIRNHKLSLYFSTAFPTL